MATAAYFIGMQYACADRPRVVIEAIPASNDVNLPGLATTETLTRHVNLNYFSEAVSWEGEERLADADSWRITGHSRKLSSRSYHMLFSMDVPVCQFKLSH
jgi:hypothetical protein